MDAAEAANGRDAGEEESGRHEKVSFTGLFRYADGTDVLLMLVGTLASLANGMSQPLMTLFFGDALDAFGRATTGNVLHRVNKVSPS
jgi:ATP-binding cassette subfamily B (MDR/TAP) protein 1